MTFMTLNGIKIPVTSCTESEKEYGDRTPSYSGMARKSVRAVKRQWSVTTGGLHQLDFFRLRSLLRGTGLVFPMASSLYSADGYPASDSSSAVILPSVIPYDGDPVYEDILAPGFAGYTHRRVSAFVNTDVTWLGPPSTNKLPGGWTSSDTGDLTAPTVLDGALYTTTVASTSTSVTLTSANSASGTGGSNVKLTGSVFIKPPAAWSFTLSIVIHYTSSGNVTTTQTYSASPGRWTRVQVTASASISDTYYATLVITPTSALVVGTTVRFGQAQVEQVEAMTPYMAYEAIRGGPGYVSYDVAEYTAMAHQSGLTLGFFAPMPTAYCRDSVLWSLGQGQGFGLDLYSAGTKNYQYPATDGEGIFSAKTPSATATIITDTDYGSRQGVWAHHAYRWLSQEDQWRLGTSDVWRYYRDFSLVGSTTNAFDIREVTQLTLGDFGGSDSAFTQFSDVFLVPYGMEDYELGAAYSSADLSPLGTLPYLNLGGDVVDSTYRNQVKVLAEIKSGDTQPRTMENTWQNTARIVQFTLTEA